MRPTLTYWRSLRSAKAHWQKIWSNNPIERLNKEIKRRADVVEIFPNPAAFLRLATAVVIEAHDEWQVTRGCGKAPSPLRSAGPRMCWIHSFIVLDRGGGRCCAHDVC